MSTAQPRYDSTPEVDLEKHRPIHRRTSVLGNAIRGALIGIVETIPGISGGTVALVVGIYEQLIDSIAAVISAGKALLFGPNRAEGFRTELRAVHWKVVIPTGIGMVLAVFLFAGPMAHAVETYPEHMRGLFIGMVLASVLVPINMARADQRVHNQLKASGKRIPAGLGVKPWHYVAGVIAAVLVFWVVSQPPSQVSASQWMLIPAGALAVSALVLPGLSGSFVLLTIGLYQPVLQAVDNLDFVYLGVFMIGLVLGLIVVVKILRWLLTNYHTAAMVILTAIMLAALRSLWPWQSETNEVFGPAGNWPEVLGLAVLGFVLVFILVLLDQRLAAKAARQQIVE